MSSSEPTKIILDESELPRQWYNIQADLPTPMSPPLHPGTGKPVGPDDLAPVFPMNIIEQEVSPEPRIAIPDEVRQIYALWRPTPLRRAVRLEQALQTPAHIYYKYEGTSPAGSHKPNSAVAQAYYNKQAGIKRIATETGAGQWGTALSFACTQYDLDCKVYMVRASYDQKPYRRIMMETWGASVVASPSEDTNAGRTILAADPDSLRLLRHVARFVGQAHVLVVGAYREPETGGALSFANGKADFRICTGPGREDEIYLV